MKQNLIYSFGILNQEIQKFETTACTYYVQHMLEQALKITIQQILLHNLNEIEL